MVVPLPPELVKAFEAEEAQELGEIIRTHRPEHFDALRQLVAGGSTVREAYRTKALYALGRWGDPSVVPEIVQVLPQLREVELIAAIDALGRFSTSQAIEAVGAHAKHASPQVRKLVVQALTRIGGPAAQKKLRTIADEDAEAWIRELAVRSLRLR